MADQQQQPVEPSPVPSHNNNNGGAVAAATSSVSPNSAAKKRVPVELEPLGDLEKGDMSDELWKELQETIQYEAASVQATGVIVPSPARKKKNNGGGVAASNENSPASNNGENNNRDRSLVVSSNQESSSASASLTSTGGPRNHPAMVSFFQALSTMGMNKTSFRGLAMLHNAAQLGVWHSHTSGTNAQLRAQVAERAAANSQAIDDQLREATERARVLREEQQQQLEEQRRQQEGGEKNDSYLRDLQRSRIDAEFERMRDQLRAEDAARREQLDHAREQKAKAAAEEDLAERKRKIREERERRHKEREDKARALRQQEQAALAGLEGAIREHKTLRAKDTGDEEH